MTTRGTRRNSGSALVEFALVGVPALFLTLSVFEISIAMWEFHTMAEAAQIGARYVVTHGSSCACQVTPAQIATVIEKEAVGLVPSALNLTLKSATSTITCTVANCVSGTNSCSGTGCPTTDFPPAGDSTAGNDITVALTYSIANPLVMYWPGGVRVSTGRYTLGAQSVQEIVY